MRNWPIQKRKHQTSIQTRGEKNYIPKESSPATETYTGLKNVTITIKKKLNPCQISGRHCA